MAEDINTSSTQNDLDIKIGVGLEDYKIVASKIDGLVKNLETNTKFNLNVDFKEAKNQIKEMNKELDKTTQSANKRKAELTDIGRGYKGVADAMKALYEKNGDTVKVTDFGKNKKTIQDFTVEIHKADDAIEKLKYSYDEAQKGFVFQGKSFTDTSSINNAKKTKELDLIMKEFNLKFQKLGTSVTGDTLSNSNISIQIEKIKESLKGLNKLSLSSVRDEIKSIRKDFEQVKEDSKTLDNINKKSASSSDPKSSAKEEVQDVVQLSREYEVLNRQIIEMYKDKGDLEVISKGDLENIDAFTVKIKQADGLIQDVKYKWSDNGKNGASGFYVEDIKNIDKRLKMEEEAAQKTQSINAKVQAQKEKEAQDEINRINKVQAQKEKEAKAEEGRINKINNIQKKAALDLEKMKTDYSKPFTFDEIIKEAEEFEARVRALNNVPLDKLQQETKELELIWKKLQNTVSAKGKEVGNVDVSWLEKVTTNTKKFFEWYVSANLIMQSKEAIMSSVREIKRMDEATVELNKVTDMSAGSLKNMQVAAMGLSTQMGKLAPDIMLSMAEFGRITKDADLIQELTKTATLASNVTSFTPDQAASALNTTVLSMKLDLKDSAMILDQFNEIQNNYRTGAEDLAASISVVGSAATQVGVPLEKLNGYTTALVSTLGVSGDEAGTAWVK